jgi:hypothetical protein
VRNVGGGQIDHQQPPIGIHSNIPLAPHDLLACVKTALSRRWRLLTDWLSITPALTTQHQFDIVDCLARQFPEPAIDRLSDPEMDRQHPPATTREPDSDCYRVDNLAGRFQTTSDIASFCEKPASTFLHDAPWSPIRLPDWPPHATGLD